MLTLLILTILSASALSVLVCGVKEIYGTIEDINNYKEIYGNIKHSTEHILMIVFYLLSHIGIYCWILFHGVEGHGMDSLIEFGFSYILIMHNISGILLIHHLYKERTDPTFK